MIQVGRQKALRQSRLKRVFDHVAVQLSLDAMYNDELPHEIVVAIQQILDLQPEASDDPFDGLLTDFKPGDILNSFFPDGACHCSSSDVMP